MRRLSQTWILVSALAIAGAATAQAQQQSGQAGQAGPQPNHQQQKQGSGLFPPGQPTPMYSTSSNASSAALQNPGTASPNAGNTGSAGAGGTTTGWSPQQYKANPDNH